MLARANVRRMSRRASARAGSAAPSEPLSTSTRYNVPRRKGILHPLFPREFDPGTAKIRKMTTRFHRGFAFGDRSATEDSRFHRARAHSGVAVTRIPVGGPPRPDGTPRTPLGAERHVFGRARAAFGFRAWGPSTCRLAPHRGFGLAVATTLAAFAAVAVLASPPRSARLGTVSDLLDLPNNPDPVHLRHRPRTARARGEVTRRRPPDRPVATREPRRDVRRVLFRRSIGPRPSRRRRRRPRTPLRHGIHGASPG